MYINWDARCVDDTDNDALLIMDRMNAMLHNHDTGFYNRKFKRLCICMGDIGWMHGTLPCGSYMIRKYSDMI
jgi:hypothetical protein